MNLLIQELSKTYSNGTRAIHNISLDIGVGMFGLLGPNGAGKSSLMRTLATLQYPDSGSIHFAGQNIFEDKIAYRKQLGYLPQSFGVYPKSTANELLDYFAILKGIVSKKDRRISIPRVLEITNLTDVANKRVSTFSGGMKQRFGIAQLLINNPKIIIVDEPTAGLDPAERTRFLNVLRSIGSENIVLFSTHLVEDVKDLCHDMAVINQGSLLSQINPVQATREMQGKIWETDQVLDSESGNSDFILLSSHYNSDNKLVSRVYHRHNPGEGFKLANPKLEDYYFLTLKNL